MREFVGDRSDLFCGSCSYLCITELILYVAYKILYVTLCLVRNLTHVKVSPIVSFVITCIFRIAFVIGFVLVSSSVIIKRLFNVIGIVDL